MQAQDRLFWYAATVDRVVDGDTVDLTVDLGLHTKRIERMRLYGIDTPETYGVRKNSAEYIAGVEAREALRAMLSMGQVWARTVKDRTGKYGRYLVDLFVEMPDAGELFVNEELVSQGHAKRVFY